MGKKTDQGNYLNNSMNVLFTHFMSNLSCLIKKEIDFAVNGNWAMIQLNCSTENAM